MSVTRLKRKHRKNIARANNEVRKIKNLLRTPVLKNVDLDELKAKFGQSAPAGAGVAAKASQAASAVADTAKAAVAAVAGTSLVDKVKEAASDAVEAVSHNSLVEKIKEVASDAVEAVAHSSVVEAVQEAAHNVVEGVKHALENDQSADNQSAQANQTGTEGYDAAEAETKPVNEDGQEGDKPKPEIAL